MLTALLCANALLPASFPRPQRGSRGGDGASRLHGFDHHHSAPAATCSLPTTHLGIYDLTIEGDLPPGNFQYYRPPLQGSMAALRRMIAIMGSWTDPADPQRVR